MYAVYVKKPKDNGFDYQFKKEASLFGCNNGYVPYLLKATLDKSASEPLQWQIDIKQAMKAVGEDGSTLIINLKPNSVEPNLSLYELIKVWGYSSLGWMPVMFYLQGLFIDADPKEFNEKSFARQVDNIEDPIFSMTYLTGTVLSGNIHGRWTSPGPSSTNSVLLWPETFEYFANEARKIMHGTAQQ